MICFAFTIRRPFQDLQVIFPVHVPVRFGWILGFGPGHGPLAKQLVLLANENSLKNAWKIIFGRAGWPPLDRVSDKLLEIEGILAILSAGLTFLSSWVRTQFMIDSLAFVTNYCV